MHHVYLMTHQEYRGMLSELGGVILLASSLLAYTDARGLYINSSEIELYIFRLHSYRSKLVNWWNGSRIGNPPTGPSIRDLAAEMKRVLHILIG